RRAPGARRTRGRQERPARSTSGDGWAAAPVALVESDCWAASYASSLLTRGQRASACSPRHDSSIFCAATQQSARASVSCILLAAARACLLASARVIPHPAYSRRPTMSLGRRILLFPLTLLLIAAILLVGSALAIFAILGALKLPLGPLPTE